MKKIDAFMSRLGNYCIRIFSRYMWIPLKQWVRDHLFLSISIFVCIQGFLLLAKLQGWL
ncbi:hypothetical protein RM652_12410 [Mammaliicoccus sciuri]|uniref:hypothetical protein n=1 Tax=Mammaliicoccus sciuri TaxID=1296 RepID=UPI0028857D37|nr:hypothetical protein [Mammaliicoccus sciuri]MDT0703925.1 hypothetical protein [Mammaliicoccus sciuri]